MFKTCIENRITRKSNGYKCYLCHLDLNEHSFETVLEHIEESRHRRYIRNLDKEEKNKMLDIISSISEVQRKIIVENDISIARKDYNFRCYLCHIYMVNLIDVYEHIRSFAHQKCFKEKYKEFLVLKDDKNLRLKKAKFVENDKSNLEINKFITEDKSNLQNNEYVYEDKSYMEIPTITNKKSHLASLYACSICEIPLISSSLIKCHCMFHLFQKYELKQMDVIYFDFKNNDVSIFCLLCQAHMDSIQLLEDHLKTSNHTMTIQSFPSIKPTSLSMQLGKLLEKEFPIYDDFLSVEHTCQACNVLFPECDLRQHIDSENHCKNVIKYVSTEKREKKRKITKSRLDNSNHYICFICNETFITAAKLLVHYECQTHLYKLDYLYTILNEEKLILQEKNSQNKSDYQIENTDSTIVEQEIKFIQPGDHTIVFSSNLNMYKCYSCRSSLTNMSSIITHISKESHIKNFNICKKQSMKVKNKIQNENTEGMKIDSYYKNLINELSEIWNTTKSVEINKSDKLINYNENIKSNTNKKSKLDKVSTENLDTKLTSINDELNELVELSLSSKQKQKLRGSLRGQVFKANKTKKLNSRFNMNLFKYANKYLELCITPGRENIYGTSREKMNLLHLGAYLSCTYKGVRICIVCQYELLADDEFVLYEHLQSSAHCNNISELNTIQKEFKYYGNQPSDMDLAYEYMVDESNYIQCFVCDVTVSNSIEKITGHIASERHVKLCNYTRTQSQIMSEKLNAIYNCSWYYAHLYFCDICKTRHEFEMDFVVHLMSDTHTKSLRKLNECTNFEVCPICSTCWYGTLDTSNKHYENSFHQHFLKRNQFVLPNLTKATENLVEEGETYVNNLIKKCSETNYVEQIKECELLKSLEGITKSVYSNVKAYIFGSRLSKLGMPNSDVDVFLDCEESYYDFERSKEESEITLQTVSSLLEKQKDDWIIDEIVYKTRVPIIKTRHVPTNLQCDISCLNGLGVEKSKMLGLYNHRSTICGQMILFLKQWLVCSRLSGPDGINSYAISWFVIFYLQILDVLPSVSEVLTNQTLYNDMKNPHDKTNTSLQEFLKGFFAFYAEFDYQRDVICPYLGRKIKKHKFVNMEEFMVDTMNLCKSAKVKCDYDSPFRLDSPMCIQDPFEITQNITKAVTKITLRHFIQYCSESTEILDNSDQTNLQCYDTLTTKSKPLITDSTKKL